MKIVSYSKRLDRLDLSRKVFSAILFRFQWNIIGKLRAFYHFKTSKITVGKHVRVHGLSFDISVGAKTAFYDNCIFELGQGSEVGIGSNVVFSYGVVFACVGKITIGDDVQIGEYSSIRDSTHRYDEMDKWMK